MARENKTIKEFCLFYFAISCIWKSGYSEVYSKDCGEHKKAFSINFFIIIIINIKNYYNTLCNSYSMGASALYDLYN